MHFQKFFLAPQVQSQGPGPAKTTSMRFLDSLSPLRTLQSSASRLQIESENLSLLGALLRSSGFNLNLIFKAQTSKIYFAF